jgi:hypothetical protein
MYLADNTHAPGAGTGTTIQISPNASQANQPETPNSNLLTNIPPESKPFPWLWVGIGGAVLVWYFFLRKK